VAYNPSHLPGYKRSTQTAMGSDMRALVPYWLSALQSTSRSALWGSHGHSAISPLELSERIPYKAPSRFGCLTPSLRRLLASPHIAHRGHPSCKASRPAFPSQGRGSFKATTMADAVTRKGKLVLTPGHIAGGLPGCRVGRGGMPIERAGTDVVLSASAYGAAGFCTERDEYLRATGSDDLASAWMPWSEA
jgi:hypothetical protein